MAFFFFLHSSILPPSGYPTLVPFFCLSSLGTLISMVGIGSKSPADYCTSTALQCFSLCSLALTAENGRAVYPTWIHDKQTEKKQQADCRTANLSPLTSIQTPATQSILQRFVSFQWPSTLRILTVSFWL